MGRKKNKAKTGEIPSNNAITSPTIAELLQTMNYIKSDIFTVDLSPIYGRFLKTKVNVKKGQLILKEKFLIAGPRLTTDPICIGCHSEFNENTKMYPCPKCKWLLCNPKCTKSPFHQQECKFLQEHQIQPAGQNSSPSAASDSNSQAVNGKSINNGPTGSSKYIYGSITILRGLLLKLNNKIGWQKLMNLQSHNIERQQLPIWKVTEEIINIILCVWNLKDLFTENEVATVCGIFEINSFEMGDCFTFGGIFPISSLCAHSCVPNCSQSENIDDLSLEIYAMVDIPIGKSISLCYDACTQGTRVRQQRLRRSKYFDCHCERCEDPTELGTNFSTIFCTKCKKGLVTKEIGSNNNNNNSNSNNNVQWKCNKCSTRINQGIVDELLTKYSTIASTKTNIKLQEEFLIECKPILHPNHFILFGIKFSLCLAYGREKGYEIEELNTNHGHRKLELCQEVLKILNILTPGFSISRGNILYEQQAAEVLIAKNLLDGGRCSKNLIRQKLRHSMELLEEAIQIFELNYPTKLLARSARNTTMKELEAWISTIK